MNALIGALLLAGVSLLLYPPVSRCVNARRQSRVVETYDRAAAGLKDARVRALFAQAEAFNKMLYEKGSLAPLTPEEQARYAELLNPAGDGVMGVLKIPKLGVELPIFHDTTEEALQRGVGHLAGTSLPTGGANTHASLSGHRGLPSARLLTDLDQMEVGDRFSLNVLGRALWYEVDRIMTVLPQQTEALAIVPGGDYVTLITCTPYAVNTHRLLVRGVRREIEEGESG